jgi:hypothetical protein
MEGLGLGFALPDKQLRWVAVIAFKTVPSVRRVLLRVLDSGSRLLLNRILSPAVQVAVSDALTRVRNSRLCRFRYTPAIHSKRHFVSFAPVLALECLHAKVVLHVSRCHDFVLGRCERMAAQEDAKQR